MQERQKHIDAFNTYYGLGTKRSLAKLHQHLTKTVPRGIKATSLSTLKIWSHKFRWQKRIMMRDREVNEKAEKRIVNGEIDVRINSYTKILELRDTLLATLSTAFYKDKDGKNHIHPDIGINSARELKDVAMGALKCETEALHILAPEEELKHTGTIELITPQLDPEIAKEAAKLITKRQSEQSIAKKTKP